MSRTLEQIFTDAYLAGAEVICAGLPDEVNAARNRWLESFNLLGMPSAALENYRHCDLSAILEAVSVSSFDPVPSGGVPKDTDPERACRIRLVNGLCTGFLTALDNGVVYGSLRAALNVMPEIAGYYYNRLAANEDEALTALNSLFMRDGAFVYVPENVQADKTVFINSDYASGNGTAVVFPRVLVVAGKGSQARIALEHSGDSGNNHVIDMVREVFAEEGARISFTECVDLPQEAVFLENIYTSQRKSTRSDSVVLYLKSGVCRLNSTTDLAGTECESNLYALYFGTDRQLTDLNVRMNHLSPDCTSSQLIKGIVSGEATGSFTGRVYVARDAQRTVAYQQNRNLQLSDESRIFTEPQLEIYADDVKCSHGATVGQMDDQAVYYMRQRGISEKDALRLQLSGFVNDVISHCGQEEICSPLREKAEARINEL